MGCFVGLLTLGVEVPDPKVHNNSRGVDVVLYAKFQPQGSNGLVGLYRHYTHAHSQTQTRTRTHKHVYVHLYYIDGTLV